MNLSPVLTVWVMLFCSNNTSVAQDSLYLKAYDANLLYISFGKGDMIQCQDKSLVTIAPEYRVGYHVNYRMIKLDAEANFVWACKFENTWAHAHVSEDGSGNLLIATSDTTDHALIIKLNQDGDLLWARRSSDFAMATDVITIGDYHYLVGSAWPGSTKARHYITKFDSVGNVIWSNRYSTYAVANIQCGKSIGTADNALLLTANFDDGAIVTDTYFQVLKVDTSGAVIWSKASIETDYQTVYDITESPNGDFAMTGAVYNSSPDLLYYRVDENGNFKASMLYHQHAFQEGFGIYPTEEGGYMICAEPEAYFDREVPQIAMMRIDEQGTVEDLIVHNISEDGAFPLGFAKDDFGYFISGISLDSFNLITLRTNLNGEIFCNEVHEEIGQISKSGLFENYTSTPYSGPLFENATITQTYYTVKDTLICINPSTPPEIIHYLPKVPNVFSPDGDGINDFFLVDYPYAVGYTFTVIDRWGRTVFVSYDPTYSWDGVVQSSEKPATAGVYFYSLQVGDLSKHGTITLIR